MADHNRSTEEVHSRLPAFRRRLARLQKSFTEAVEAHIVQEHATNLPLLHLSELRRTNDALEGILYVARFAVCLPPLLKPKEVDNRYLTAGNSRIESMP